MDLKRDCKDFSFACELSIFDSTADKALAIFSCSSIFGFIISSFSRIPSVKYFVDVPIESFLNLSKLNDKIYFKNVYENCEVSLMVNT